MGFLQTLSAALGLLLALGATASAAPIAYPFRVTDNSGALVPGATVAVGATALTSGGVTALPAAAGEKVLSTGLAPASAPSVTLLDYGTGDYALVYDAAATGELYLPLSVSKSGSTITGGSALIALVASADPSNIASAQATSASNNAAIVTTGVKVGSLTAPALAAFEQGLFGYVLAGTTFGDHVLNSSSVLWGGYSVTYPDATHQSSAYTLGGTPYVASSQTLSGGKPASKTVTLSNQ